MRNSLNSLASDRAFGSTSSFLCGLINKLSSGRFDDAMLVGFGGIAVTSAISEPLNHFEAALPLAK